MYRMTTLRLPPSTVTSAGSPGMDRKLFKTLLKPVNELAPAAPPLLCDVIHRCLEYDPKNRPERVGDVLDVLNVLIEKLVKSDDDRLEAMGW